GVPGDSTAELLARIETEAKARVQYYRPDNTFIILIGIGMNDLREVKNTKKPQTSPLKFKRNLLKIVKIAKKYTDDVVLVGITPVDEKRSAPFEGDYYFNKRVQQFNAIIRNIAKGNYIDVYNEMIKTNYTKLLIDGVHPNKQGYAKMYKIIKEFLKKR
ncbi:SGNH/GDSL hydrolase family protein, partial [Candidatus Woesearchaeota archaeon]|nr:SGNH/GDSL hydrolase family protein [Candidatus Woesearchaeota archaeon]